MNLQIIGDRIHLSPSVKYLISEKIEQRLDKLLSHLSQDLKVASIHLIKDKYDNFTVNFDMNLGKDHIFATTTHIKLESALIDLSQAIEKQIKKHRQTTSPTSLS